MKLGGEVFCAAVVNAGRSRYYVKACKIFFFWTDGEWTDTSSNSWSADTISMNRRNFTVARSMNRSFNTRIGFACRCLCR